MTYEQCGCGASILSFRFKRVLEWRESHRHEPGEDDQPLIHESGSSHERLPEDMTYQDHRPPMGFRPNA